MDVLPVTIFSDFACPYSYVTETALRRRAAEGGLAILYRAYELYPAPAALPSPDTPGEWEEALHPLAAEVGIEVRARAFRTRTRKAHEAARFARDHDAESPMRASIFEAYWRDGRDIGRIDELVDLGVRIGLDRTELKIALDIDSYADAVIQERAEAVRIGVTEIPTTVLGRAPAARVMVGAQSYADFVRAIEGG